MRIMVTGGFGFIGSAVVRHLIAATDHDVLNVDKMTYAGDPRSVGAARSDPRYREARIDICDADAVGRAFHDFDPDVVIHLAAESHVDRSIDGPGAFVSTNVVGTFVLLNAALARSDGRAAGPVRFVHVSTDEVFGSLGPEDPSFTEQTPYRPQSPYSASKAAADHLARAWSATYGLPVIVTNCSNNYGEFQFPEKLIPLMTIKALAGEELPVYGAGENVRDWLWVGDHVDGLVRAAEAGTPGETYLFGGGAEMPNLAVVEQICDLVADVSGRSADELRGRITFVDDRPGHDLRYSVDCSRTEAALGWSPSVTFATGLRQTVDWYAANRGWWEPIREKRYRGDRLGSGR